MCHALQLQLSSRSILKAAWSNETLSFLNIRTSLANLHLGCLQEERINLTFRKIIDGCRKRFCSSLEMSFGRTSFYFLACETVLARLPQSLSWSNVGPFVALSAGSVSFPILHPWPGTMQRGACCGGTAIVTFAGGSLRCGQRL